MQQIDLGGFIKHLENFTVTQESEGLGTAISGAGLSGITFIYDVGESLDTLSGSVYFTLKVQKSVDSAFSSPVAAVVADLSNASGLLSAATITIDDPSEDGVQHLIHTTIDADYDYYRAIIDVTGSHSNGTPINIAAYKHHATLVS